MIHLAARYEPLVVALALAVGLLLRIADATSLYLNADEAMHFCLSQPPTWHERVASLSSTPHIFFFVVHFVQRLSDSELVVRLPFLLAGLIFPWIIYRWLRHLKLPIAALAALLILEFSPNLVMITSQVRGYGIALLFVSSALYFLETSLESRSIPRLLISSGFLYLAILTEFSSAFACAALGIYAAIRLYPSGQQRLSRYHLAWAGTQIGALSIYLFLYQFMMKSLLGSTIASAARQGYLRSGFPGPEENSLFFAAKAVMKQFAYLAGSIPGGLLFFVLFCIAVAAVFWKLKDQRAWILAVVGAFGVAMLAGVANAYPFGRTRHSIVLSVLATPIVALGIQWLLKSWPRLSPPALVVCIAALWHWNEPDPQNQPRTRSQLSQMQQATQMLQNKIPSGAYVLADQETIWLLRYYLAGKSCPTALRNEDSLRLTNIEARHFAAYRWSFSSSEQAQADAERLRRQLKLPQQEPIFLLDGGFDIVSGSNAESLSGVFVLVAGQAYRHIDSRH